MRWTQKINQGWQFAKQKDFTDAVNVTLPHSWNAIDGQDGGNDYYRGQCWYRRNLHFDQLLAGHEYWLQFDAVAQRAQVFLNGHNVGHHDGGYSAFRINITQYLTTGDNQLIVAADNLPNDHIYPQKADFTFYGGITRDVSLIETSSPSHFALGHFGDSGIKITPQMDDDNSKTAKINVKVITENTPDQTPVTVQIGSQAITELVFNNQASLSLDLHNIHRWDGINDPYLYLAQITLGTDTDYQAIHFGCRSYHFDPDQGFMLNGHPYRLVGAAKHEDFAHVGSAVTREMEREDCQTLLEMGGNAFRLAHYQHSDYEYSLADQLGILVWAEIPMITKYMPSGDINAQQQLTELICQNWNHASIFCWTLSNEITVATGVTAQLLNCHQHLNDLAHQLDDSRLTCIANAFMLETDSPLLEIPDIRTYNLYYGWYMPGLEENEHFLDQFHQDHPQMMIGLSEYGADNNPQIHSDHPVQGDYSEEYASLLHEHILKIWSSRPWLSVLFPWTLFDFAADGREEGGKPGQNQKGLVTNDRRIRKDSFYIYKAYLAKQPFVHICGHQYTKRPQETQLKVYSNQSHVQVYLNGQLFTEADGQYVFSFPLKLSGKTVVEVRAKNAVDQVVLQIASPDELKQKPKTGKAVTNWFDDPINPKYYSLDDSINDLLANPKTKRIYEKILAKATSAFGDVAKESKMPPAMAKKMNSIPLTKQLRMVSRAFKPGEIEQYNRELQQIPKNE